METVFQGSHLHYHVPAVPKPKGPMDCGLYTIAYATHLVYGKDPQCLFQAGIDAMSFSEVFKTRTPYQIHLISNETCILYLDIFKNYRPNRRARRAFLHQ